MGKQQTDIATRALVVTLKAPCGGAKTTSEVAFLAGISPRSVDRIYGQACQRGFDPNLQPVVIKNEYLEDAPCTGRPSKQTPEIKQLVVTKIQRNRYGREKTCEALAAELTSEGISILGPTIYRIL